MAVHLRLRRMGTKKRPVYAVVAADQRSPRDGRYIEKLGNYYPLLNKDDKNRFVINKERVEYWLKEGARPTDRITRLLSQLGLCEKPKPAVRTKKHLPKAKAQQRLQEKEEARKNAEEASKKAAAEAASAAEAPKESAPEAPDAPAETPKE